MLTVNDKDKVLSNIRHNTFGAYVRRLREKKTIGMREMARRLDVSPSYLNDIEKNKRVAPRTEIVRAMSEILEADSEKIFDLAGLSKDSIPPDVLDIIRDREKIVPLLRMINNYNLTDQEIQMINKNITTSSVKALIIAAGTGSRLKSYTEELPKCMLKFGDKTLLEHQLEMYGDCGINNVALIRGFQKEKIDYPNIRYYENSDYENNNILNSIFYAEEELGGHVIVAYSDILFESNVVERLLQSEHDISIVVDIDWRAYYVDRAEHPIEEAENVVFDANNNVIEIGKILTDKHDVHGEFIGMMKLSPKGAEVFKRHFHRAKSLFQGKPFQRAKVFEKAYLTDMIQEMADLGVPVHCVIIERGWKEIDTVEDYEKALEAFKE